MKKLLKLVPAFAMLLVAAILVSTSTYAWFSMNTTVQATNMQVRAVAEKGLLINEIATAGDSNWDEQATANQTSANPVLLYPASTADGATWYHGASKKSNSSASATSGAKSANFIYDNYENLTTRGLTAITAMGESATAGTKAFREVMGDTATSEAGYYVHYTYYLKGASGTPVTLNTTAGSMNVNIKSVSAELPTTPDSANLDKALRVGILMKSGGTFYIYAPVTGYTGTYYVAADTTATTPIAGTTATATDLSQLPAAGTNGVPVEVYIWFEGEDANCMSDNALAATLDNLKVDIAFSLEQIPTP